MSRKSAAAASTALSIAEFIDNYPGMPEGARAAMLLLKLDIVSFLHYAFTEVLHCPGLSRENISSHRRGPEVSPPSCPLQGNHAIGRGVGQAIQEANTKRAATFTVFPQPIAPSTSYSTRPYV